MRDMSGIDRGTVRGTAAAVLAAQGLERPAAGVVRGCEKAGYGFWCLPLRVALLATSIPSGRRYPSAIGY